MLERGDHVLFAAHSQFRGLFIGLARRLRQENGAVVHLYVATPQQSDYYRRTAPDAFDEVVVAHSLYADIGKPVADPEDLYRRAAACEERLGTSFNSIVLTDRHLGRGFSPGGYRHPRSIFSETADYPRMVRAVLDQIGFWEGEIDRHRPKLLINCGKSAAVIARARGIPYRALIGARHKNLQYWAHSEFGDLPQLAEVYGRTGDDAPPPLDTPYTMHVEMRRFLQQNYGMPRTLKSMALTVARYVYWHARGYEKARGLLLGEELGYLWRRSSDAHELARSHRTTLQDLDGRRFVYFPLHMEPEIALQGFSPECFTQLACIASLARDLPAGVVLAVKETFAAFGRRPRDFYGQIAEFKNVVLLRPDQLGLELAKRADATATITGTGGFEAAVSGRPVISFGRHNLYNILPHVFPAFREEDLAGALRQALNPAFDRATAARNGQRFLQAVIQTAFDLEGFKMLNPDVISESALAAAHTALLASLQTEALRRAG